MSKRSDVKSYIGYPDAPEAPDSIGGRQGLEPWTS